MTLGTLDRLEVQSAGPWQLQFHDKADDRGREWGLKDRPINFGARYEIRKNAFGIRIFDVVPETYGDISGGVIWPFEKKSKRRHAHISWAHPVQVTTSPALPEEPAAPSRPRTTDASSGPTAGLPTDPMKFRPALKVDEGKEWERNEDLAEFEAYPWDRDARFPKKHPGAVVAASDYKSQQAAFLPAGGLLVAPHRGGLEEHGSLVYEVNAEGELDLKRKARLQSALRVYKVPKAQRQDLWGKPGKGALALQLGRPKKPSSFAGLGVLADEPIGGGGEGLRTVSRPGTGDGGKPAPATPQALSAMSYRAGGFAHPGFGAEDKHYYGSTEDGDHAGTAHIDTNALYAMDREHDGPLPFSPMAWKPGSDFPKIVNVYLAWDKDDTHGHPTGSKKGRWKLMSSAPDYVPPPPHDGPDPRTPRIPDDPFTPWDGPDPGGPDTPPPPPGIPVIPGIPVTPIPRTPTGGGGGFIPQDGLDPFPERTREELEGGAVAIYHPFNLPYLATWMERAGPGWLVRPQHFAAAASDLRNRQFPSAEELRRVDESTPVVVRLEGHGAQLGDSWDYSFQPGAGRYGGGIAPGTLNVLPGNLGLEMVFDDAEPGAVSETYFNLYRSNLSHGKPSEDGGITDGFAWSLDDTGTILTLDGVAGDGTIDPDAPLVIDRDAQVGYLFGVTIGGVTGGPPSGAAGGDLTGSTYPNPTVATVGGVTAANIASWLPSADQKAALGGMGAYTPSAANPFVSEDDLDDAIAGVGGSSTATGMDHGAIASRPAETVAGQLYIGDEKNSLPQVTVNDALSWFTFALLEFPCTVTANWTFSGTPTFSNQASFTNGTVPFSVTSTNRIDNLNAQLWNNVTGASPAASGRVFSTSSTTAGSWVAPGGDVSGAISSLTVTKLQNFAVSSSSPSTDKLLIWNGSAWAPSDPIFIASTVQLKNSTRIAAFDASLISTSTTRTFTFPNVTGTLMTGANPWQLYGNAATTLNQGGIPYASSSTAFSELAAGNNHDVLYYTTGSNAPAWRSLSAQIDAAIGSTRGAILYRGAGGWAILAPGTAGQVLTSNGAGADPSWV